MLRPLVIAARGKGVRGALKRVRSIVSRYGFTSTRMAGAMDRLSCVLRECNCPATFAVTATVLAAGKGVVERYRDQGIEIAVHGYRHVDHTLLPREKQRALLEKARRLFHSRNITPRGFRAPYLRSNGDTIAALSEAGYLYDASPAIAWDVPEELDSETYRRALAFYGAVPVAQHPSLPRLSDGLVRMPYCLPDDEALVERLAVSGEASMKRLWLAMLEQTHRLGELLTLGLHPERALECEAALAATLQRALSMEPRVWVARLENLAQWWIDRARTDVLVRDAEPGVLRVAVRGPQGLTVLARGVEVMARAAEAWDGQYQRIRGSDFVLRTGVRPFIGVSASCSRRLVDFLGQQGFIVEEARNGRQYALCLDRPRFEQPDERPLLAQIEDGEFPLVRLGRWPDGARSALCVTGDIDALTVWDYAARFLPSWDGRPEKLGNRGARVGRVGDSHETTLEFRSVSGPAVAGLLRPA